MNRGIIGRLILWGLFAFPSLTAIAQVSPLTNAAPNVIFVPITNTSVVAKHPTLPVLYAGSQSYPRNLLTVQLGADGMPVAGSAKAWGDFFGTDTNDVNQTYSIARRPGVSIEHNLLYIGMQPNPAAAWHANSNRHEFAAIKLDPAGLPSATAKAFRVAATAREQLIWMQYEPALNKLLCSYYVTSGFVNLGADGLPIEEAWASIFGPINLWHWTYVPNWKRFFSMAPAPSLFVLALDTRNLPEFSQMLQACETASMGAFVVNETERKIYLLDTVTNQELVILNVTAEGRVTGTPRRHVLGPSNLLRADFKARRIYGVSNEMVNILALDAHGLPTGKVQSYPLNCGYVWDALMDESTGKLYIGCQLPPVAEK